MSAENVVVIIRRDRFGYVAQAKLNGFVAGEAHFDLDGGGQGLYLATLEVHPLYQGKKIGTRIVSESINFAVLNGFKWIELCCMPDNQIALKLYKKAGFYENGLIAKRILNMRKDL